MFYPYGFLTAIFARILKRRVKNVTFGMDFSGVKHIAKLAMSSTRMRALDLLGKGGWGKNAFDSVQNLAKIG